MPVPQSRTQWAERQAEELLSVPFIAEFVLRSPQMIDGTQKEVADLLILYQGSGLLVSQKAQEDPLRRDERKNELWVLKAAKNGLRQLVGALRPSTKAIWCEHPRRGRVAYAAGLPPIVHGIVTVETCRGVDLQSAAADLPLAQGKIPLTYISVNDFLNVATQLRTVPELLRYLDARRELPEAALRRLGNEQPTFELYLLYGTSRAAAGTSTPGRLSKRHRSNWTRFWNAWSSMSNSAASWNTLAMNSLRDRQPVWMAFRRSCRRSSTRRRSARTTF